MGWLATYWPVLLIIVERGLAVLATLHILLHKRDERASIGWIGLVWLSPLFGVALYVVFGVNRILRRGAVVQGELNSALARIYDSVRPDQHEIEAERRRHPRYRPLVDLIRKVTDQPLMPGNAVTSLVNGETAFPEMLAAIERAERSIGLCSYIFDNDRAGREFIDALVAAVRRGVEVRVLIDDVGSRYSRPTSVGALRERGVNCRTFLPTRVPRSVTYANLRNHRKIMVVDGRIGFAGGMNIREGCRLDWNPQHPVQDVHFRLEGPVSAQIQEAFAADWSFATGELLTGDAWFPSQHNVGDVWARGIPDGPDEDFDVLRTALLGAIAIAQDRLLVVTPYFLPDAAMVAALCVAAMRGVDVRIVLPAVNNIVVVQWACMAHLRPVLERGCRVFLTPPPFDHSKLMIVDDAWTLIGSSNWDPRSLRLNFEFNVECYDEDLATRLAALAEDKIAGGRELTLDALMSRPLPIRIRDAIARLGTPYL